MSLTLDGNSIVFEGTATIVNGFNPETGVAYLVLTPKGGFGTLPFLATGESGLPPEFTEITMVEVDPGNPLPAVNPVKTLVDPGGPGVASKYTLKFYVHAGQTGATGSIIISDAEDLDPLPALGSGTDAYILVYKNSTQTWVPTAQKVGNMYVPSTILSTAFNNASPRLLSQITIPAQPFNWYPRVFAQVAVTGSSDTRVDVIARLNDPSSGQQIGFSKGQAGSAPPVNVVIPAPPAGSAMPGAYGLVNAGVAATIYLRAEQKAGSSNSWSTPGSPDTTFCVEVVPIL
jgi:hypothetical protein